MTWTSARQRGAPSSLRRRPILAQPALFMTVRRSPTHPSLPHTMGEGEGGDAGQARGARLGARGKSRDSDRKFSPLASSPVPLA